MGEKAAAAAKSEITKGDKLRRQAAQRQPRAKSRRKTHFTDKAAAAAKSEISKGDKLGRQGSSGSQKRNHEASQAWETSWQRQPRAKSRRETSLEDKPAEAAKSEIMKGAKLHGRGSSGSQKRNHEGRQAWETRRQRQPKAKS